MIARCLLLTIGIAGALAAQPTLFRAVEVASTSTKGVLLKVQNTSEGPVFVQVAARVRDADYISMRNAEGDLTEAGLGLVSQHVGEVLDELGAEAKRQGLPTPTTYVVGSSGIAQIHNQDALRRTVFDRTEVCMDFVTPSKETYYALWYFPVATRRESFSIDIGGGNTKGGYLQGTQWRSGDLPFGARSLRDAARARAKEKSITYELAVQELVKEKVVPAYNKIISEQPGFGTRKILYLYAGTAWATVNWSQPAQAKKLYRTLTLADFDQYLLALQENTGEQKQLRWGALPTDAPADLKGLASANFADSTEKIDRDSLIAGVSIARAIIKASNPDVKIVFRETLWLPGYGMACYKDKGCDLMPCGIRRTQEPATLQTRPTTKKDN